MSTAGSFSDSHNWRRKSNMDGSSKSESVAGGSSSSSSSSSSSPRQTSRGYHGSGSSRWAASSANPGPSRREDGSDFDRVSYPRALPGDSRVATAARGGPRDQAMPSRWSRSSAISSTQREGTNDPNTLPPSDNHLLGRPSMPQTPDRSTHAYAPPSRGSGTARIAPADRSKFSDSNDARSAGSAKSPFTTRWETARANRPQTEEEAMDWLGSVSRSGGFGDGVGEGDEGDALKDFAIQEKFREHIQSKLHKWHERYPDLDQCSDLGDDALEKLNSVLLLFRKLREGIMASHRVDRFAIETYETSALYALIAENHPQIATTLLVLVRDLHARHLPDLDPLETGMSNLSMATGTSSMTSTLPCFPTKEDKRTFFASLLLLYQACHVRSSTAFWDLYFDLTSRDQHRSSGKIRLRDLKFGPGEDEENAPAVSESVLHQRKSFAATRNSTGPAITPYDPDHPYIKFAFLAHRAIITPDPLLFSSLLRITLGPRSSTRETPLSVEGLQHRLLRFDVKAVRDKSLALLKAGYREVKLDWCAEVLAFRLGPDELGDESSDSDLSRRRDSRLRKVLGLEENALQAAEVTAPSPDGVDRFDWGDSDAKDAAVTTAVTRWLNVKGVAVESAHNGLSTRVILR